MNSLFTCLSLPIITILLISAASPPCSAAPGGQWDLLQRSIGIAAMHMQLLNNDRVAIFDRTDFGPSNISLPNGKCRQDPYEVVLKNDCTAHSVEYDVASNTVRPLMVQTDVWCSSGSVTPDGRLIQTGGFNDGERTVRIFAPCDGCDWVEIQNGLVRRRWYATNQILPNGIQIIIGGRKQFNYEFYPKVGSRKEHSLPFLVQTNDRESENNLYPFVHLNVDGNLFIFANNRAILFDYARNRVVKSYPTIPDSHPRNYPSTGSSVLLPLKNLHDLRNIQVEVLVCGGAPKGAHVQALKGKFVKALDSCGRIKITDPNPQWVMEKMPMPRVMGDMTLLPNGDILIINGGSSGTAGWELGRDPVLSPVLYKPNKPIGTRFDTLNPSTIPRMYHSTAILLRDGRVLVGGSNPHIFYNFTGVIFPTELSLESFSPPYLDPNLKNSRPTIINPQTGIKVKHNQKLTVRFTVEGGVPAPESLMVTMVAPPFTTHSFSMNQRALVLEQDKVTSLGKITYEIRVTIPGSRQIAPPGYYLLFVVHADIPSQGIWVNIL